MLERLLHPAQMPVADCNSMIVPSLVAAYGMPMRLSVKLMGDDGLEPPTSTV